MYTVNKFLKTTLTTILLIITLIVSTGIQIIATNYYVGFEQKKVIEKELEQKGISSLESIVKTTHKSIIQKDVKVGYAIGLLIAWLPWFLLGMFVTTNLYLCAGVILMSLISYSTLWINPIIFITSFFIGARFKSKVSECK